MDNGTLPVKYLPELGRAVEETARKRENRLRFAQVARNVNWAGLRRDSLRLRRRAQFKFEQIQHVGNGGQRFQLSMGQPM